IRRFAAEILVAAGHSVARVALFAVGQALLLPVALVPLPIYPVLAYLWSAVWLCFEYLDLPMARHLYAFREVRAALRSARPISLGFGGPLAALFLVPIVNLVSVPVGVVGGTLLYADLRRSGLLPQKAQ